MARKKRKASKGILSIDIGGTKVKILATGETEPRKMPSGSLLQPAKMVDQVRKLAADWKFDRVSIGYPGLVGVNGPLAEPGNLGAGWVGFDYAAAFECPVRIANDAAMQALGSYDGGRMLFIGLGTGVGSSLIVENVVVTLELGDLAFADRTVSEKLGRASLEKIGKKKWRGLVFEAVPHLQKAFLAEYVVLGGGNSKYLGKVLPPGVRLGNNLTAFRGGFRLWGIDQVTTLEANGAHSAVHGNSENWRLL
jgi:polyphosphate glucokinase